MKIRDLYFILAAVLVILGLFTNEVIVVLVGVAIAIIEAYREVK